MRNCAFCERPARKRGMCNRHYLRWWKSTPSKHRPRPTVEERFWAKVQKQASTSCWEWTAARKPSGHGIFVGPQGKVVSASSFSLELHLGYRVPAGMECCHRCDNPPCVNPRHLYFGTRQSNVDDAWARGRMPVGSERSAAKIDETQVLEIRNRYADGAGARELAEEFGIAISTLRLTVLGRKWKHVGGPITARRSLRKAS